ncbi:MAG TPA: HAD hydrolase family protein [Pirellulaceae bacterium]|nr:HAD hydrolase family protein [Pirellulaceae bacterium]HMO93798.1 HAD hydrolase family protein [Pirellulaceae bacterium]HMP70608.1 HAD hydrolase family protein [Pirellulaceae bacterium]
MRSAKLDQRLSKIRMILSDVDGVLTDGGIYFDNQGIEIKRFHVRDGLGIKLWKKAGFEFGLVTARSSHIVKVRAAELGIDLIRQGFSDKLQIVQSIAEEHGLALDQICFIGDDLTDLGTFGHVGLAASVADAIAEVRAASHIVTKLPGGAGAVRELIEMLLKSQALWDGLVQSYTKQ